MPEDIAAFIKASEDHENRLNSDARKQARAVLRVGLTVGVFALLFMALAAFFGWQNLQQSNELDDRAIDLAEVRSSEFAQEAHRMFASDRLFPPDAMVMAIYAGPKTFNYGLKPKLLERVNFSAVRNALSHLTMRNKIIYATEEGSDDVRSIAIDPSGQRFVSAHDDSLVLWRTDKLDPDDYPLVEDSEVYSVAFHPDGQRIATAHDDGAARIWRLGQSEPLETFLVEDSEVYSVAFHPDGQRIATAHDDGAARIWQLGQSEPLETFLVENTYVNSVAFHPDGQRIATAHDGDAVRIWQLGQSEPLETFSVDDRGISIAAFHPDGKRLVTGHTDGARVWRLGEADPKQVLLVDSVEGAEVYSVAFHEDADRIFTGHGDGKIRAWQLGNEGAEPSALLDANLDSIVTAIAIYPSGTKLVAGYEGILLVWDIDDPHPQNKYELPDTTVNSIAINSGNERFALTRAGLIGRWQPEQQELEPLFELTDAPVYHSAFQPNGNKVIAVHSDGIARLWEIGQTEPIESYDVAGSEIVAPAIHSGGQKVATAHYDGFIRLWKLGQSEPTAELFFEDLDKYGARNGISSIAFHHDGERIITGHKSGFIQVWRIGRELPVEEAFISAKSRIFWGDAIETVAVHPDGEIFISVSKYGHAALWRFGNREPEYEFQLESSGRHALAFDSEGNRLTVVFEDGMVEEWQIPEVVTAKLERQIELVCAKLSEMSVPTAFPIISASSYRSLRDVPVDSNNPDFLIDPCISERTQKILRHEVSLRFHPSLRRRADRFYSTFLCDLALTPQSELR